MPRDKDLKRLTRARMSKTGEAYTTARAHILKKPRNKRLASPNGAAPKPTDFAAIAGMSDEVVKEKTGCTWERWVYALDRHGAHNLPHREIAQLVRDKYNVADWWTQMVTVGYERIKGLRARGQRRDGSYEASKSRTYNVPVTALFNAWKDARVRKRWLSEPNMRMRTATAPKSMRLSWSDGSIVAVWFTAKTAGKSSVAVQHTKLADRETTNRLKQYWSERLDSLAELLAQT